MNSSKLGVVIADSDLLAIAQRSKGTPRILNARLQWYKSCVTYFKDKKMSVEEVFSSQGIDKNGLDMYDRMYLKALVKSKGSALGIKSLSALTGIAMDTVENSIEPFLVRKGYVIRTPQGRVIGDYISD